MTVSIFCMICTFSLFVYIFIQVNIPKIKFEEFKSNKVKNDIKILQVSDYHNKKLVFKKIFYKLNKFNPDIVVITGDLIDRNSKDISYSFRFIENILNINTNVFFVSGNHEYENKKHKILLNFLEKKGVTVLNNKNSEILVKESNINIIGADHLSPRNKLKKGMYKGKFNIMIIHSPNKALTLDLTDIDLVLSGHTHGGQVRLPFLGSIITPDKGIDINSRYDKGSFRLNDETILYIDSGFGYSRLPLRFLNRSQISEIVIKSNLDKRKTCNNIQKT